MYRWCVRACDRLWCGAVPEKSSVGSRASSRASLDAQTVAVYNDGVDFDHLLQNKDSLTCSELLKDALFTQAVQAGGQRFEKGACLRACVPSARRRLTRGCAVAVPCAPVVWQESRPRFWFVAIAACADAPREEGELTPLTYELHMLNPGGAFQRQFSKDKQLEFEAFIAALAVHVLLAVPMVYGSIKRAKSEALCASAAAVVRSCRASACTHMVVVVAVPCSLCVPGPDGLRRRRGGCAGSVRSPQRYARLVA